MRTLRPLIARGCTLGLPLLGSGFRRLTAADADPIVSVTNAQKLSMRLVPAPQQLGALIVSGAGALDGIYLDSHFLANGKPSAINGGFALNYSHNLNDDGASGATAAAGWLLIDQNSGPVYYSESDVASANLATNWKNASDGTATSITVTAATSADVIDYGQSVKVTDLLLVTGAGAPTANGEYLRGAELSGGKHYYTKPDTGSFVIWNTFEGKWFFYDNVIAARTYESAQDVSEPWLVTSWQIVGGGAAPAPTFVSSVVQTLQPPSESFVMSGDGAGSYAGLYVNDGGTINGKPRYKGNAAYVLFGGGGWGISDTPTDDDIAVPSDYSDVPVPWLANWSDSNITLTPAANADPTVVVVSGAGGAGALVNGIFIPLPGGIGGKSAYYWLGGDFNGDVGEIYWNDTDLVWSIISNADTTTYYTSADDVAEPWLVSAWTPQNGATGAPTVTAQIQYPAVFVSGAGTPETNGIYTARGNFTDTDSVTRPYYKIFGSSDAIGDGPTLLGILHTSGTTFRQWILSDDNAGLYYASDQDAAFPWLPLTWREADIGTAPAPTLTPVTQGELDAGVAVAGAGEPGANGTYPRDNNARSYGNVLPGGGGDGTWVVTGDNGGYYAAGPVSFPWQATYTPDDGAPPAPTVSRNDVAAEANWQAAG